MTIDSQLPLMGRTPDYSQIPNNLLQTAQGIQGFQANQQALQQQQQEAPMRQALLQGQVDQIPLQNQQAKGALDLQKTQIDSLKANDAIKGTVFASIKGNQYIDSGDMDGFINFNQERAKTIAARGGDPSDTLRVIELAKAGDIERLRKGLDAEIQAGEQLGIIKPLKQVNEHTSAAYNDGLALGYQGDQLRGYVRDRTIREAGGGGDSTPAAIKEFQYYNSLSPEGKAEWDRNKRGDRVSTQTEKNIFSASDAAQEAGVKYTNYSELAKQYEASAGKMSSGTVGSAAEWLKEQMGSQDAVSLLRKDWAAAKTSEVVRNLPDGSASDADVRMALSGFLPNNANPQAVASFLRGTAKLSKIDGEYQSFKADYLSENKSPTGMLKAWKEYSKTGAPQGSTMSSGNQQGDMVINGVTIKRVR